VNLFRWLVAVVALAVIVLGLLFLVVGFFHVMLQGLQ
jgi:hypothetical protein